MDTSNNSSNLTNELLDRTIFQLVLVAVLPATIAWTYSDIHKTSTVTSMFYLQKSIKKKESRLSGHQNNIKNIMPNSSHSLLLFLVNGTCVCVS